MNQLVLEDNLRATLTQVAGKRSYRDSCGIARALDLVGERWALLIVRELLLGPKRFSDLRGGLPNASPNVLSQRLRELEGSGLVDRRKLDPPANVWVYELSARGQELEPVVLALGRWGSRTPIDPDDAELSVDALMVALKTVFDADRAADQRARLELRFGDDRFRAEVGDGQLSLTRGHAQRPDASLDTDVPTLRELVFGAASLDAAVRSGRLRLEGDGAVVGRFLRLFPLQRAAGPVGSAKRG